jgi:integrase
MPKAKSGYIYQDAAQRWYARFDYLDECGKRRTVRRRAKDKTGAKELLHDLLKRYKDFGQRSFDGDRMTFNDLAKFYEETFLIEPQYVNDRKIAGVRDWYNARRLLAVLKEHFGKRKLNTITHGDLQRYRILRLKTPTLHDKQRSIATVNRELSLLRRVLNVAKRNRWVIENPFQLGEPLIRPGDEKPRERIISREEEERLLMVCTEPRAHLRPVVIAALDTGMRCGELLKLRWPDVNFKDGVITIRALNTKTMRERQVAMTERLERELWLLYKAEGTEPDGLCFGIEGSIKKAFGTARRLAGLPAVRFHDLRHTHATRLVAAQIPLAEVGRILGHTQPVTTYRYVNANVETARRAAAALNTFNNTATETPTALIQ